MELLTKIGVKSLLIQPWPPNFVPLNSFLQTMRLSGWTISKQEINYIQGYHYISCCLTISDDPDRVKAQAAKSDTLCIEHFPLFKRCAAGDMGSSEKHQWLSYLAKQQLSLKKRKSGRLNSAQTHIGEGVRIEGGEDKDKDEEGGDNLVSLSDESSEELCTYNLDSVIELVGTHLALADRSLACDSGGGV